MDAWHWPLSVLWVVKIFFMCCACQGPFLCRRCLSTKHNNSNHQYPSIPNSQRQLPGQQNLQSLQVIVLSRVRTTKHGRSSWVFAASGVAVACSHSRVMRAFKWAAGLAARGAEQDDGSPAREVGYRFGNDSINVTRSTSACDVDFEG